jgi:hypothetical protein
MISRSVMFAFFVTGMLVFYGDADQRDNPCALIFNDTNLFAWSREHGFEILDGTRPNQGLSYGDSSSYHIK